MWQLLDKKAYLIISINEKFIYLFIYLLFQLCVFYQQCKRSEASKYKLKEITAHVVLKLNFLSCSYNYAQAVSAWRSRNAKRSKSNSIGRLSKDKYDWSAQIQLDKPITMYVHATGDWRGKAR